MRCRRPLPNTVGVILITLGIIILLALVLPSGFWWFVLGMALIALGIFWTRRC